MNWVIINILVSYTEQDKTRGNLVLYKYVKDTKIFDVSVP